MKPNKIPLKRSKTGLEIEYHLLDNKGGVIQVGPQIVNQLLSIDKNMPICKEIGQNMIEIGCYPDVVAYSPSLHMTTILENVLKQLEKINGNIYPFATYPGKFNPEFSSSPTYKIKEKIFGRERLKAAARVTGFHHHYTLPKGVFDMKTKTLRMMKRSKLKRSMVSSYNFEIASDPVMTLFTQSSPFYQGKHFAKDTRMVVYRGGNRLRYPEGVYSQLQQIGGLPPYKQTATDLIISLEKRQARWEREVKKVSPRTNFNQMYPDRLDIGWNPIKINKHGTLEERGMDANLPSILVATTVLLKFSLRTIQREFVEVFPTDFGVEDAFKIEKNMMFIPPHTYVRNHLQAWSAYDGFAKKEMHNYATRFYKFAKAQTPKKYVKLLAPIDEMMDTKKSMSDQILAFSKKKKWLDNKHITDQDAKELALKYADVFRKDLTLTKVKLEKISAL